MENRARYTKKSSTICLAAIDTFRSGVFAPGWDIALDINSAGEEFLTGYGGGSPFLEDSASCAALSSFWPAAAPDTARVYPSTQSNFRTSVAPLMDNEIGLQGGTAWDGQLPPRRFPRPPDTFEGKRWVRYASMENCDYVEAAMLNRFYLKDLAAITLEQYTRRILAMLQVYSALGADLLAQNRDQMLRDIGVPLVLSFRCKQSLDQQEIHTIKSQFHTNLPDNSYRWEVFRPGEMRTCPENPCFRLVEILSLTVLYTAGMETFWKQEEEWAWHHKVGLI